MAAPPEIIPISEVKAGMVGEALTVFQGTKPEPFKFRVVSVLRNFLPKQDVVLIRAEDPRVEKSGIVAGMSGSPCYINGKLMGALAYAWSFAKEPLAGVTPIESMLAERGRPLRRKGERLFYADSVAPAEKTVASNASPLEPRLVPVSIPLSVSGLTDKALFELRDELSPFGMVPVRASGSGPQKRPPGAEVLPGGAIGVELVRGDMSVVGTGTVTWVDGDTVLAFGHPMLGAGEVNFPLVNAEIHAFMSSMANSFKLSSPLGVVGALMQDRQPCIIGDLKKRSSLMPLTVTVTAPDNRPHVLKTEVARERRLMPLLTSMVMSGAVSVAEPDPTEVAVTVRSKVAVRGHGVIELEDHLASADGLTPRIVQASRGVRALAELLANPFEPVVVERMDVDVKVEFRRDFAEIIDVALPEDEIAPGATVPVRVTLRPYAGPDYTHVVPVSFPRALGGQRVRVEVASGAFVKHDTARPENLRDWIANLRTYNTSAELVVSLTTGDTGAALRGRLLPGLPPSALDTLKATNASARSETYRVTDRTVVPFPHLVSGKKDVTVYVQNDVLGAAPAE